MALFVAIGQVFSLNAQISVGSGNNELQAIPIEAYYGYTYSQSIYLQPDINSSGNITSLAWYFSGTSNLSNTQDIVIWMGHTTKVDFRSTTDWIDTTALTRVYAGTLGTPAGPGWITLTLSTPFAYNNVDNLVIAVDENTPGYNSSTDDFYNTATTNAQSIYYRSDPTNPDPGNPPTATGTVSYIPNIILGGLVAALPPNCDATPTSPAAGATSVVETTSIDWAAATGSPSGYKLQIGTTSGGSQFLAQTDVGAVNSYQPTTALAYSTTYYVTITPYNANGDATGCTEYSFTTRANPTVTAPWIEDVESHSTTTNATITTNNWIANPAATTSLFRWNIDGSGSTPSSNTGPTNGANSGLKYFYVEASNGSTNAVAELTSPPIDISGLNSASLYFYYHMFGGNTGALHVDIYDGTTWNNAVYSLVGQQQTAGTDPWLEAIVDLSSYNGVITVRFRAIKGSSFAGDISLDDIKLDEAPVTPPNCDAAMTNPANAATGVVETTSINWSNATGGPTGYNLSIGTTSGGTDILAMTDVGNVNTYQPSAALPYDTTIYVNIIPYSANGTATACTEYTFRTRTDPTVVAPWSDDFESHSTTTNSTITTNNWISNPTGTTSLFRWNIDGAGSTPSSNTGPSNGANSGSNYLYVEASQGGLGAIATLTSPPIDISGLSTPRFRFFYHMFGASTGALYTEVYNGSSWVGVDTLSGQQQALGTDAWLERTVDLSAFSGTITVRFTAERGSSFDGDISLDDVFVEETPSCLNPTGVTIDTVGTDIVTFNWTPGGSEANWNIEYGLAGFTQGTGTSVTTSNKPYTINGLTSATDYDIYIQAICGEGKSQTLSPWTGPISVSTNIQGPVGVNCVTGNPNIIFSDDLESTGNWTGNIGTGVNNWNYNSGGTGSSGTGPNAAHSGSQYVFVETSGASVGTNVSFVSPLIDLTAALNTAELSFWVHAVGAQIGTIQVGVGSSAAGPFTNLFSYTGAIQGAQADPWQNVGVNLDAYVGQPIYLEFNYITNGSFAGDIALDLIEITTCANCPSPSALTTSNIMHNAADLSWTAGAGETEWELSYGPAGFALGSGTDTVISSNPYTLSGLMEQTSYSWYIRAICAPGDSSGWAGPITFTTPCTPVNSPYTQDFDGTTDPNIDACWTVLNTTGSTSPWIRSENDSFDPQRSGSNSIEFYNSFATTGDLILVSPMLSDLDTTKRVRFYYQDEGSTSYQSDLIFGTLSDPNDAATFTPLATILAANMDATWKEFEYIFSAYGGTDKYVGIKHGMNTTYDYLFIDDFIYDDAPTCLKPTALMNSGVTTNSALLAWTENSGATQWEIEYGISGFGLGAGTVVQVNSNPYNLTGLMENTTYDWYVKAICSVGDSSEYSGSNTFVTLCSPYSTPYSEGFETGYVDNNPVAGCLSQESISGTQNWTANSTQTTYNRAARSGSWNITLRYSNEDWIYIPINLVGGTEYTADVYARQDGATTTNASVMMAFADTAASASMLDTIAGPVGLDATYQLITGKFTPSSTGTYYVGIKGNINGSPWYISLDDIAIYETPNCFFPTNLMSSSVTSTSAQLAWTENNSSTQWEISYGPAGFAADTGTKVVVNTNPYTLTGLSSITAYDWYVRTICGAGDTSLFTGPNSFTTLCGPFMAPYTESFDAAIIPSCWSQSATTGGPWVFTNPPSFSWNTSGCAGIPNDHTGNGGNYAALDHSSSDAGVVLEMNDVNVSALTNAYLSFYFYMCGNGYTPINLLYVEAWDGGNWNIVDTIQENTNGWKEYGYNMNAHVYNGNMLKVRFRAESGGSGTDYFGDNAIDDVSIVEAPSCIAPNSLMTNNVGYNSADVSWVDNNGASQWEVEYGASGFTQGAGTTMSVSSNSTSITGLSATTTYDWYVRALCGAGDNSAWTGPSSFTTNCAPYTSPYSQNFDGTVDPNIDECWSVINTTGSTSPWIRTENDANDPQRSGANSIEIYNSFASTGDLILVSPMLSDLDNSKRVRFYYQDEGSTAYISDLIFGTLSDPTNAASFTPLDTILAADMDATWKLFTYIFSNYSGSDKYVGLKHGMNSTYDYIFVDDFMYDDAPTCIEPLSLTSSNVTNNAADIAWTENNGATQWQVEYGTSGFSQGTGTIMLVNSNPTTLSSLSSQTGYDWYVRAICGSGDTSEWAGAASFTTMCDPIALPYVENFENAGSLPNCWMQSAANQEDWKFGTGGAASYGPTSGFGGSGYYAWLDDSESPHSDFSGIETPMLNLAGTTHPGLEFQLWSEDHEGQDKVFMLYIDVNSGSGYTVVDSFDVNNTNWEKQRVYLGAFAGQTIQVRFRGEEMSSGFQKDIAIDAISIADGFLCDNPERLRVHYISDTSATLRWDVINAPSIYYLVRWKPSSSPTWTNTQFVQTNLGRLEIKGLSPNTLYTFMVRSNCYAGWSDQVWEHFRTYANPCYIPTNATAQHVFSDQVKLTWDAMPNALKYRVRYRAQGTTSWTVLEDGTSNNFMWIPGLSANTTYEYQVKSVCAYGFDSGTLWNAMQSFTTKTGAVTAPSLRFKDVAETKVIQLELYPNPTSNDITINYDGFSNDVVRLQITDLSGRVMKEVNLLDASESNQFNVQMNDLSNGIYFINIFDGENRHVEKVIKN